MALWFVNGKQPWNVERQIVETSVVSVGWVRMPDLSRFQERTALTAAYRTAYPSTRGALLLSEVSQLHAFCRRAQPGDLVLMPLRGQTPVAIGEIAGDYAYRRDLGAETVHTRPVRWLATVTPLDQLGFLPAAALDSRQRFHRLQAPGGEENVRRFVRSGKERSVASVPAATETVEQQARAQIVRHIADRLGVEGTLDLIEAILRVRGAITRRKRSWQGAPPQILVPSSVGRREAYRLCVEVDTSGGPVGPDAFDHFERRLDERNVEQGILVSFGGFLPDLMRKIAVEPLRISLWASDDLLEAIFSSYEQLPTEVRGALPLKRAWMLDESDPATVIPAETSDSIPDDAEVEEG